MERFRDQPAVFDDGRVLLFSDLADALDQLPRADRPVLASGTPLQILLSTLQAWRDGQALLPIENPELSLPSLDQIPAKVAHLKLTPGTDGRPRAIYFSAEQLASDADRLVDAMGLRPTCPHLATISLTHSYGFSSIILPLLLHGIPLQTVQVPFPAVLVAAWKNHPKVTLPAVPSMWRAWHRSGILERAPIALAISAGAPLALDLEQAAWKDHQLKIHNFYGASECGGISYDQNDTPRSDPHDLGNPLPGVDLELDPDHHFRVKSSSVALGYDSPGLCQRFGDGSFLTPDRGHLEGGRLFLEAHDGDTINVAGRKLGPARIESALRDTGLIERARVFGIPSNDPERVDEVAALVSLNASLDELKQAASLQGWELPRHWITDPAPDDWTRSRAELRKRFAPQPRDPSRP